MVSGSQRSTFWRQNSGTLGSPKLVSHLQGAEGRDLDGPLVMSDSIAPTNDPIGLFRSPSYAYSFASGWAARNPINL